MADDLGGKVREVHAEAAAILRFWFDEMPAEARFAKDDAVDRECERRFGDVRDAILASGASGWRADADSLLAAVIALDQFSRNIHRGGPRAFEADALALSLAREAIANGWDTGMDTERCQFLYMPFQHAEDANVQAESVALFARLGDRQVLEYAQGHKALIDRFGRFPHRNQALGRRSTPEELEYLSQPGAGY
ncbi:DUF924 domain-containing protein [Sphingomonas gilva]|uniref:DUF924 domain-containing protein n=1 Tax=Sphingomonas gilva TaxID=2305907 RepID=A0A396RLA9_9SPHN|nr:DUF924 family protein [Sphingomonas gilva]RHW17107.1 DUF924 domain-containing protein [Sphingomonas gilva]